MKEITVFSPAKLNLYLNVLDKRPDGYHNIETIFERIDLCDEITIEKRSKGIRIESDSKLLPLGRDNLIYRAIEQLSGFTGRALGAKVFIKKRIPISGGLGGGSSNAASAILATKRLYDLDIDRGALFEIARRIGSDAGFFLTDYTYAVGRGVGDEIERVDSKLLLWQVLISPRWFCSTARMYEKIGIFYTNVLTDRNSDVKLIKKAIEHSDVVSVGKYCFNAFEKILLKENDSIRKARELLCQGGAIEACLSGSGPTMFGIFKSREEAMALKKDLDLQDLGWDIFVVKSLMST